MVRSFAIGIAVLLLTLSSSFSMRAEASADNSGILYPQQNATTSGIIDIQGRASHPSFRKWQIDLVLDSDPNSATFIAVGDNPADAPEMFATLDTSLYPDGDYQLRLRVVHSNLNYNEYFTPIQIRNRSQLSVSSPSKTLTAATNPVAGTSALPTAIAQPTDSQTQATPSKATIFDKSIRKALIPAESQTPERTTERTTAPSAKPVANPHTLATRLDIPFDRTGRWIEVELATQTLRAWEGDEIYLETAISSGEEWTPTVQGVFHINRKYASQDMVGRDYNLPDVPAVMYFFSNYAIHGAYWHDDFGKAVSHGCVNMREDEAIDLFEWASMGTPVFVYE